MNEMGNECVELKRQNALCVPRVEIDFTDDEYLEKILRQQELKDMERKRINKLKEQNKKVK